MNNKFTIIIIMIDESIKKATNYCTHCTVLVTRYGPQSVIKRRNWLAIVRDFFAFRGSFDRTKSALSLTEIDLIVEKTYEALATRRQKRWRGNWNEPKKKERKKERKERHENPGGPPGCDSSNEGTILTNFALKESGARAAETRQRPLWYSTWIKPRKIGPIVLGGLAAGAWPSQMNRNRNRTISVVESGQEQIDSGCWIHFRAILSIYLPRLSWEMLVNVRSWARSVGK